MTSWRETFAAYIFGPADTARAFAGGMFPPSGEVILEVEGVIHQINSGQKTFFDLERLDFLPQTSFQTATICTKRAADFLGQTLRSLLYWHEVEPVDAALEVADDHSATLFPNKILEYFLSLTTCTNGFSLKIRNLDQVGISDYFGSFNRYISGIIYKKNIMQNVIFYSDINR